MTRAKCNGARDCSQPATHIDSKGWVYCVDHAPRSDIYRRCRKMTGPERRHIALGFPLPSYQRSTAADLVAWRERRVADEYESAAEWCANRGLIGADGDPLPEGLSVACHDEILADTYAFGERVRAYAYALAMEEIDQWGRPATPPALCSVCGEEPACEGFDGCCPRCQAVSR